MRVPPLFSAIRKESERSRSVPSVLPVASAACTAVSASSSSSVRLVRETDSISPSSLSCTTKNDLLRGASKPSGLRGGFCPPVGKRGAAAESGLRSERAKSSVSAQMVSWCRTVVMSRPHTSVSSTSPTMPMLMQINLRRSLRIMRFPPIDNPPCAGC